MSVIEKARPGGGGGPPGGAGGPLRGRRRRRWRWPLLVVLAAVLVGLWWLRGAPEPEGAPPAPAAEARPESAPPGAAEPPESAPELPSTAASEPPAEAAAPAPPLPRLAESDPLARELATPLSANPLFVSLLRESGLIDRFVLLVDNLAEGIVPRRELAVLKPRQKFQVLGSEPELRIDPASYRRYDLVANAIASLDAAGAVAAYRRVAPLCEESYRALGYPEGGFEARLRAALALLLSTPQAGPEAALVAETLRYEFADPALQSLSDAQKQLLRMGPENGAKVRAKLRQVQTALGAAH